MTAESHVTQSGGPVPQEIKDARKEVKDAETAYAIAAEKAKVCKDELKEASDFLYRTIDDLSEPNIFRQGQDNE